MTVWNGRTSPPQLSQCAVLYHRSGKWSQSLKYSMHKEKLHTVYASVLYKDFHFSVIYSFNKISWVMEV